MPISDGYDTCQKIRMLYDKDRFINKTSSKNAMITGQIHIRDCQPLIVAWTSENLNNQSVRQKIDEAGFDLPIESPIVKKKVEEEIMPLL